MKHIASIMVCIFICCLGFNSCILKKSTKEKMEVGNWEKVVIKMKEKSTNYRNYEKYDVFKTLYLFPDGTLNEVIDSVGEGADGYDQIGKGTTGVWETLNIIEGDKQVLFYRYNTSLEKFQYDYHWRYFTADRPTIYYALTKSIVPDENKIILHIDVID